MATTKQTLVFPWNSLISSKIRIQQAIPSAAELCRGHEPRLLSRLDWAKNKRIQPLKMSFTIEAKTSKRFIKTDHSMAARKHNFNSNDEHESSNCPAKLLIHKKYQKYTNLHCVRNSSKIFFNRDTKWLMYTTQNELASDIYDSHKMCRSRCHRFSGSARSRVCIIDSFSCSVETVCVFFYTESTTSTNRCRWSLLRYVNDL